MIQLLIAIALAHSGESLEPPLAVGPVPLPIVQNTQNGFVPYHLIPVERRFPVADAALERCRAAIQNRPKLWRR